MTQRDDGSSDWMDEAIAQLRSTKEDLDSDNWLGPDEDDDMDLESDRRDEAKGAGKTLLFIFGGVLLVVGVAVGAYFLFFQDSSAPVTRQVATVRAPVTPMKVEPDDPGGMEIPNQDKLVYDRLDGADAMDEGNREVLMPAPEMPEAPAMDGPEVTPAPSEPVVMIEAPAPSMPAPEPEETMPEPEPMAIAEPMPVPEPDSKPEPMQTAAVPGDFQVQIAALRSADDAETAWTRLSKRYDDLLGGLPRDVVRADLGEKGIYYRLRVGAYTTRADAVALCEALKARKGSCLVVKR